MKLTDKELKLIRDARQAVSNARFKTLGLLLIIGVGFVAFFAGVLNASYFAGLCMAASIAAILMPQIGGPKYQELVALLTKIEDNSQRVEQDPIIDALSRKP